VKFPKGEELGNGFAVCVQESGPLSVIVAPRTPAGGDDQKIWPLPDSVVKSMAVTAAPFAIVTERLAGVNVKQLRLGVTV